MRRFHDLQKLKLLFILLLCLSQIYCGGEPAPPKPPIKEFAAASKNEAWIITEKRKVVKISDGGTTNEEIKLRVNAEQIFFLDENKGWILDSCEQIWATENGGKDWSKRAKFNNHDSGLSTQLVFANEQIGWLVTNFLIWLTEDGGRSWTMIYPTAEFDYGTLKAQPTSYFPISADEGWLSMYNSKVLRTTNRGKTWENVSYQGDSDMYSLYAFSKDECFVPAFTGADIYYTNDGGKNWQPRLNPPDRNDVGVYSIAFPTREIGWGVGIEFVKDPSAPKKLIGITLKTTDGGKTWAREKNEFYRNEFVEIKFIDAQNGWLRGEDSIYHTTDGGENWTKVFQEK